MAERRAQVPGVDILFGAREPTAAEGPPAHQASAALPAPGPDPLPALLAVLVDTLAASHLVQLEPPTTTATTALIASLPPTAVLTAIGRTLPEGLREQVRDAGGRDRVRLVAADPAEVLPRLSDAGYDLLIAYDAALDLDGLREQAARLLRPGGLLVAAADGSKGPLGELVHELVDDPRFRAAALPVGGGLALAARSA